MHFSNTVNWMILSVVALATLGFIMFLIVRNWQGIGTGIGNGVWAVGNVFEVIHARIVRVWVIIWERRGRFALLFLALGVFVYLAFLGGAQFVAGNLFPDKNTKAALDDGAIVVEAVSGDPLRAMKMIDDHEAAKVDTTVGSRIVNGSLRREAWERDGRQHGYLPPDNGAFIQTQQEVVGNKSTTTVQVGTGTPPGTTTAPSNPSVPKAGNGQ